MQKDLFSNRATSSLPSKGIGGSELSAIFGLHPFLSARELWRIKTGRPISVVRSDAMRRGVELEPTVRHLYEETSGEKLWPGAKSKHPRWGEGVAMRAATDGTLPNGGIFEAKTTTFGTKTHQRFAAGMIPINYALQLQHYAAVCVQDGVVCALVGPAQSLPWEGLKWELFSIRWRRIPELCALIELVVEEWFGQYVLADVPPPEFHHDVARVAHLLDEDWMDPVERFEGEGLDARRLGRQLDLF